jgi:hypothetical protein
MIEIAIGFLYVPVLLAKGAWWLISNGWWILVVIYLFKHLKKA